MSHQTNKTRIRAVSNALGDLSDRVVFVGGATVSLYADRVAPDVRPTDDVDILIEIATRWEFAAVETRLRELGFENDATSKFLGRYLLKGFVVDVMPIDEDILGFSNQWYLDGYRTAINYNIDDQGTIRIFTPPYFIAAKLEAFNSRGNKDGRTSRDFEDIVFVLENRASIWKEMNETDDKLRVYLREQFTALRANRYIREWIDANSESYAPPASSFILPAIDQFIR